MLKTLIVAALLSLLCQQSCVGVPINTVGSPRDLGWQAFLLVEQPPEIPRPHHEEVKRRRITPKSVFIAPAFSGTSPLPDCAEGYRADAMGRCVKLVQLNHAAQLDFLLQRLNAMYATPIVRRDYDDLSASDSGSSGPLQVNIPIEIPHEPEEETKESVEVAVVMADVLKDDQIKMNNTKKNDTEKTQTIVAVWNVGKNGSSLEEVETTGEMKKESENTPLEKSESTLTTSNATKYDVINKSEVATTPKTNTSLIEDEELLATAPTAEDNGQGMSETNKLPSSAMALLEEVAPISSEDGRSGNTSRRNVSAGQDTNTEPTTTVFQETVPTSTEITVDKLNKNTTLPEQNTSIVVNVSRPGLEVTSETKDIVNYELETSTQRPGSFVRFPTEDSVGVDSNKVGVNRYPPQSEGQNYVRFPQPTNYDYMQQQSMLPTDVSQRQSFWWLPPGWRLDPTRHQPMLIRFWARMPLLRDQHADTYEDVYSARRRGGSLEY